MVNNEKFAQRINKILDYYELSASSFADKIEVGRSSISHILSGRNKPSLDFILKVLHAFPDIDLYWLVNGKGSFIKTTSPVHSNSLQKNEKGNNSSYSNFSAENLDTIDKTRGASSSKNISKIIILYDNGTFETFYQNINK